MALPRLFPSPPPPRFLAHQKANRDERGDDQPRGQKRDEQNVRDRLRAIIDRKCIHEDERDCRKRDQPSLPSARVPTPTVAFGFEPESARHKADSL